MWGGRGVNMTRWWARVRIINYDIVGGVAVMRGDVDVTWCDVARTIKMWRDLDDRDMKWLWRHGCDVTVKWWRGDQAVLPWVACSYLARICRSSCVHPSAACRGWSILTFYMRRQADGTEQHTDFNNKCRVSIRYSRRLRPKGGAEGCTYYAYMFTHHSGQQQCVSSSRDRSVYQTKPKYRTP